AEALEAADAGLAACPSAQLYTSRAEALDRLHRIYDLRRTLTAGTIAYKDDGDLLRRRAAVEDGFGSRAAAAYADLASALEHNGGGAEQRKGPRARVAGLVARPGVAVGDPFRRATEGSRQTGVWRMGP